MVSYLFGVSEIIPVLQVILFLAILSDQVLIHSEKKSIDHH